MNLYKKKLLFLLMSAIFLFSNHQKIFAVSISTFEQMNVKSQVSYINSLSKPEKFRFLIKFLPGSQFFMPEYAYAKYFSDGRGLIFVGGTYFEIHWSIINNVFKIWFVYNEDGYKSEYVWTNFSAYSDSNSSLWFRLLNKSGHETNIQYNPVSTLFMNGPGYGATYDSRYEDYKKSLTPQERDRLEKLNFPVKLSSIVDNKQSNLSNYAGVYNIETSSPWTLVVVVADGQAYMQAINILHSPASDKWQLKCHNFEQVEIHGNNLTTKSVTGRFIFASFGGKRKTGLMLTWKYDGKKEYGNKYSMSLQKYLHGKYPETYFKRLVEKDLATLGKHDLKIMRNEIYARYGYQFRPNGSMDRYFRLQYWYEPINVDVSKCLTDIEKENIKFIQAHE